MKTQYTISFEQEQVKYIRELARGQYVSFSEAVRQLISIAIEAYEEKSLPVKQKVELIEKQIQSLDEQKKQLSYQRDYLKDRIEDQ
tara:strand:- start:662 stop:919 length:258 start_codon:yes stop_codon:yes gene_type:complete